MIQAIPANSIDCRETHDILPRPNEFAILSERIDAKSAPTIDNAEKTPEILLATANAFFEKV